MVLFKKKETLRNLECNPFIWNSASLRPRVPARLGVLEASFSPRAKPFQGWEGYWNLYLCTPCKAASRSSRGNRGGLGSHPVRPHTAHGALPALSDDPPSPSRISPGPCKSTRLERSCGGLVPGCCFHSSSSSVIEPLEKPVKALDLPAPKLTNAARQLCS